MKWLDSEPTVSQASVDVPAEELIWQLGATALRPYHGVLEVNGQRLKMEIDTGVAVSLISKTTRVRMFPAVHLSKSLLTLRTYTAETIPVLGQMEVQVKYGEYTGCDKLYVVGGEGPPLLGRDWLRHLRLDWTSVRRLSTSSSALIVEELTRQYAEVFQDGLRHYEKCPCTPDPS